MIFRPAVLVHAFWAIDSAVPDGRPAPPASLVSLWAAARSEFRLESLRADDSGELPSFVPPAGDGAVVLSSCGAKPAGSPPAVWQMMAFRVHDALGFTLMLAPNQDDETWSGLEKRWRAVADGRLTDTLGNATIYLGLLPAGSAPADAMAAAATVRGLGAAVPDDAVASWASAACGFANGICVWSLPAEAEGARRVMALAPSAAEDDLDRWLWVPDGTTLPPLTNYLLHAAKLRYQQRVLLHDLPELRRRLAEVDRASTALTGGLRDPGVSPLRLAEAASELAALQAGTDGLIDSLSRVRGMARTIETARANLARSMRPPRFDSDGSFLSADREVADWTAEQLRTEQAYLEAATDRVAQLITAQQAAVEAGAREHVENRTLMQTTVIGGLLTALAAIQSLQYTVGVPNSVKAPLIALVTTVVMWLPPAVLHWPRGARVTPGWRRIDQVLLGAVGAAAGWLVSAAASRFAGGVPAPAWQSLLVGVVGAALGLGAGLLRRQGSNR